MDGMSTKYKLSPRTFGTMVTPQVEVFVKGKGQGLEFKFPERSFTHIYT